MKSSMKAALLVFYIISPALFIKMHMIAQHTHNQALNHVSIALLAIWMWSLVIACMMLLSIFGIGNEAKNDEYSTVIRRTVMCVIRISLKHKECCAVTCKYRSCFGRYCNLFDKSLSIDSSHRGLRCKECLEVENK